MSNESRPNTAKHFRCRRLHERLLHHHAEEDELFWYFHATILMSFLTTVQRSFSVSDDYGFFCYRRFSFSWAYWWRPADITRWWWLFTPLRERYWPLILLFEWAMLPFWLYLRHWYYAFAIILLRRLDIADDLRFIYGYFHATSWPEARAFHTYCELLLSAFLSYIAMSWSWDISRRISSCRSVYLYFSYCFYHAWRNSHYEICRLSDTPPCCHRHTDISLLRVAAVIDDAVIRDITIHITALYFQSMIWYVDYSFFFFNARYTIFTFLLQLINII